MNVNLLNLRRPAAGGYYPTLAEPGNPSFREMAGVRPWKVNVGARVLTSLSETRKRTGARSCAALHSLSPSTDHEYSNRVANWIPLKTGR